ncbi:hypothetical protein ACFYNO_14470 [Kitasatospora sp. NPDC006697]|uniref:hypothetical protein n=1 Tax=unclassified Kitasatospora TaxID=2633591 RepID=UPI0036B5B8F2
MATTPSAPVPPFTSPSRRAGSAPATTGRPPRSTAWTPPAPAALTRGEYDAVIAYLGERTDSTARALRDRLAGR